MMGDSARLAERNVWVATVRPDGRPHLTPVWFVVHGGRWYLVISPGSVKARNLHQNAQISLALEDGDDPLVVEGQAQAVRPSAEVVRLFKEKYDWDISVDSMYTQTIEVTVRKTRGGSANS